MVRMPDLLAGTRALKAGEAKSLAAADRAVTIGAIKAVKLAGGPAVELRAGQ